MMEKKPDHLLSSKIHQGVQKAIIDALEKHRKLGESISILQDGQVVTLKGDEIARLINNN